MAEKKEKMNGINGGGDTQSGNKDAGPSKPSKAPASKSKPNDVLDLSSVPDIDEVLSKGGAAKTSKKLSVERIYQKKTQLEHILLRPDTYIGSVEHVTTPMWVYDETSEQMIVRELSYVPGLYKIFDEILVNAADNRQRDPAGMTTIKIDIIPEEGKIKIWNNGKGIPIVMHKTENMYVPTMIFGHLLTSSNYDDSERKVTGGRNGYGAKLANIFSKKFVVETQCNDYKSSFRQAWSDNMSKMGEARILPAKGEDYTCITFQPDLEKFKMTSLDKDIVDLFTRRAYDMVASSRGVKVYLNGKKLAIKNFKDYVELYIKDKVDDTNQPLKIVHEATDRWEVAVTISKAGFQQVSFVNSIATTKGGRHVDYVTDQLVAKLIEVIKKKEKKSAVTIKPFQVKSHIWVFVNCLIENPTFDSQTKENMTLQSKGFGSKCVLTDKFFLGMNKCGLVEAVQMWMRAKQQVQLNQKCSATKRSKLKDVPKLDDANDAGTKQSINCTLILTEGDSAKTLAVAGLGVIGRDKYGIFPLKGKVLNVREAATKQIMENAEINNIIKIVGLQYKEKYEQRESLEKLRYGRIMIMTDQDQDGSHIKGLLINFIHHNWPNLLRHQFLEEFITPIVKVSKKNQPEKSFYSMPEFEEWKATTDNWHTYKVKYYKGLGTSTSKEAKEYFSDMIRHRIPFKYSGPDDDAAIDLAFSKKKIEERKEWLTNWMEERKRRAQVGLPELYLYGKDTKAISYNEFVNRELILFSNMDNERSIPSLVDGFKPGQRKVIFTCIKRNITTKEIKVAQLAGSVAEQSAYHHGEVSLMSTIVNLAQNFVGSNNLNLLLPIGQFGTRLTGGKDSASPRYIFTQLSSLSRHIFNQHDDALLRHNKDDNVKIEPEWYIPILPMVLVNGAEGIGTGWSTKIPNYDIREIVNNLKLMIDGKEPLPMLPSFKNFRGTIQEIDSERYVVSGEVAILDDETIEITELPVRTWTQTYKEGVLEPMLQGTEKIPAYIRDYREYHTESTVRFVVKMSSENLDKAQRDGLHRTFKLQSSISTSSMVLFDSAGCIHRYTSVEEILREFFTLRLSYYSKRKDYLEGVLGAESLKLNNQARFIMEKCDGIIVIENKPKKEMIQILVKRNYDSDPVRKWKEDQNRLQLLDVSDNEDEAADGQGRSSVSEDKSGPDFNYLLGMAMWCLTKERKDELLKQRDQKAQELKTLMMKSPKQMWQEDLEAFLVELNKVEEKEKEDELTNTNHPSTKSAKGGKAPKKAREETRPSATGQRIEPVIDAALRAKFEAAKQAGKKRKTKKDDVKAYSRHMLQKGIDQRKISPKEPGEEDDGDEADDDDTETKTLAERIGGTLDGAKPKKPRKPRQKKEKTESDGNDEAAPKKKTTSKKTDLWSPKKGDKSASPKKKGSGKKKKRNAWSDSDESDKPSDMSDDDDEFHTSATVVAIPRDGARRAAAAKAKYKFSDSESEKFDSGDDFPVDSKTNGGDASGNQSGDSDAAYGPSDDEELTRRVPALTIKRKAAPTIDINDSDDDDVGNKLPSPIKPASPAKSRPATKAVDSKKPAKTANIPSTSNAAGGGKKKGKFADSDDSEDNFKISDDDASADEFLPKKAAAPAKKKATATTSVAGGPKKKEPTKRKLPAAKKSKFFGDTDDDESPKKKKKTKKNDDDDDDDEFSAEVNVSDVQPRSRVGRARPAAKYNIDESEDDSD